MLSRNSVLFLVAVTAVACGYRPSQERREFDALERALGSLASAPDEDRKIRLKELESVSVQTERMQHLKSLCVEAFQNFEKATGLLSRARETTQKTESLMAGIRERRGDGGAPLTGHEESEVLRVAKEAARSLQAVDDALDRAETLVNSCEQRRGELRRLLAEP